MAIWIFWRQAIKIEWFENDGSQGFTNHVIDSEFNDAISVYATDVDSDGDIDILAAGNNITWFENDGNQNFTEHTIITWSDCQYSNNLRRRLVTFTPPM